MDDNGKQSDFGLPVDLQRVTEIYKSFIIAGATGTETPEQIEMKLEREKLELEFVYKDKTNNRLLVVVVVFILAILAGIVLFLFRNDADAVQRILIPIITALVGAAGGYSYGKFKRE